MKEGKFALRNWQRRRKLLKVALKLTAIKWMWLVDLNYKFECDWLIELSDSKLSDNNLAGELLENRSFLTSHNRENCNSYDYTEKTIVACFVTEKLVQNKKQSQKRVMVNFTVVYPVA